MIGVLFLVAALVAPTLQLDLRADGNGTRAYRDKRDADTTGNTIQCGKVVHPALPVPLILSGPPSMEGQWPWHVAIYQTKAVDSKYICGGTLVSPRHVITAAHCVMKAASNKIVSKNEITVHLGKTNLRTSYEGVQLRLVEKITVHPDYNRATYSKNLAIIELKDAVAFTDWVQPACLWPEKQEDLATIVGKKGSVVGWGFDESAMPSEELKMIMMPVVDQETCIRSYAEFFVRFTSDYTYCAGERNGKSVCNGDSGGGMMFRSGDSWYLRGLVSLSVAKKDNFICDPTHYVIFTDLAKLLPWMKENIGDL